MRGIVAELEDGSFPGLGDWARWHETGELPPDIVAMSAAALEQTGFPVSDITGASHDSADERGR